MRSIIYSYLGMLFFYMVLVIGILIWTTQSNAADVTLQWDANTETFLGGYKIYYAEKTLCPDSSEECVNPTGTYDGTGATEGNSPVTVLLDALTDKSNPEFSLTGLDETKCYFFAVTAIDTTQKYESGFSNQIKLENKTGTPAKPNLLKTFWKIVTGFLKRMNARWS